MDERTELIQYLYDLQGYLVVEDVLSKDEVAVLNATLDATLDPIPDDWEQQIKEYPHRQTGIYRFGAAGGSHGTSPGFLQYGESFCRLMEYPVTMEIMRLQLGDCFRLDRIFGMRMRQGMPSGQLHSDYGAAEPFTRAEVGKPYFQPHYQALHGFAMAAFNLTDSGPETGGLCVIPGSHNSHFKLPRSVREGQKNDVVICPRAPLLGV